MPSGLAPEARGRSARHPKLDSALADLAAARTSDAQALDTARAGALRLSAGRVQVLAVTEPGRLRGATRAITAAGGEVTKVGRGDTLVQGWLPVGALEAVAASDDVLYVRRPAEPVPLEGAYTTEGVAAMGADAWQLAGYRGAGVKVAIIETGFQGYTSLLGTDLPASVTVKNFVDGETDAQVDGTTPYGTACAEVVHDVAPDAQLYLAKIATILDLQEAVTWAETQQVNVISTSSGWYDVTPGDGTGFFADLVSEARGHGILWVTAAGDDRERHWGGSFADANLNGCHEFAAGQEVDYFGPGDGIHWYTFPAGYRLEAVLRWDDWSSVIEDYDLYVVRWDSSASAWVDVASSTNRQNGGPGQTPTERVVYTTSGSDAAYGVRVCQYSTMRNVNLEVFALIGARLEWVVHERSLANLADVPDALTVAALSAGFPYPQEVYSSEGPTNGPGGTATGGAIKPDISGYASVSTATYGTAIPLFNGTGAAASHVAGAAALVFDAHRAYDGSQVRSFLEGRAVNPGTPVPDTQYGYGRLYLGALPADVTFWPTLGGPGMSISVRGAGFTGATEVLFNGAHASFTFISDNLISANVPADATTGPISVVTPGGTLTSATSFTVVPAPTITGFSPTSGGVGTSVSISGKGFTGATAVTFNGVSASYTVNSATSITATVPAGATTGPIGVTTPGGAATSATSFTVRHRTYLPLVARH